jgi:hypothetical protein
MRAYSREFSLEKILRANYHH